MDYSVWPDEKIIDVFDSTDITLRRLSTLSGRSVAYIKSLLLGK